MTKSQRFIQINAFMNDAVKAFMSQHALADPHTLSLRFSNIDGIPIRLIAEQIASRQKARVKIPTWYDHEDIIYPPKLSMEQCSSQHTALYKASLVRGKTFADLTGGAGVDTWAIAGEYKTGHYVECDESLTLLAHHNFSILGMNNIDVHHSSAEAFVQSFDQPLDCIYIDPARRDENQNKVFLLSDCTPDITKLLPKLLQKAAHILVKTSPMMDIDRAIKSLKQVVTVHVVAVDNECKEVLYVITNKPSDRLKVKTINFRNNGAMEVFNFDWSDRHHEQVTYGEPSRFLYEPNAAIMKAGGFQSIATAFDIQKLHPNTHLYSSESLIPEFPGRVFEIDAILPYTKKILQQSLPANKANITVRNFKDSVQAIRKRTGLKPGCDHYLFACTLIDGRMAIIKTTKVRRG